MFFPKTRAKSTKGDDLLVDPRDVSALREHGLIDSRRNLIDRKILRLEYAPVDLEADFWTSFAGHFRLACKILRKIIPIRVVDNTSTVVSLKSQRNELAPISILPPKILTYIFSFFVPPWCDPFWASDSPETVTTEGAHRLKTISHVCRRWREASLESYDLWTYLTSSNISPLWMAEMLSRSKEAPLHLRADAIDTHLQSTTLALQHLSRIQHLSLIVINWSWLEDALNQLAPLLTSLNLRVYLKFFPFSIPASVFSGTAPFLSRLALDGCYFPWDSSLYNNITHLRLKNIQTTKTTMTQLLATLERIEKLRELHLLSAIPSLPPGVTKVPGAQSSIALPFLSLLFLDGPALDCAHFLHYLRIPQNITLRLVLDVRNPTVDSIDDILPSVARHYHTNTIQGLMIGRYSSSGLRLQAWPTTDILPRLSGHTNTNKSTLFLRITSKMSSWSEQLFLHTLTALCSTLPLQDLRVLRWGHLNLEPPWRECMGYLRSVETLFVDADAVYGLLSSLEGDLTRMEVRRRKLYEDGEYLPGSNINTTEDLLFPASKTLVFRKASFGGLLSKERMTMLKEWLKQRKALGLGFKELHFRHCSGLTMVNLAELRDIVPEVLCSEFT